MTDPELIREQFRRHFGHDPEDETDRFFDRNHEEIGFEAWAALRHGSDGDYRRIAWDELPEGCVLSTVWTGHAYVGDERPPVTIFETCLLDRDAWDQIWRWASEPRALAGHQTILAAIRDGLELPLEDDRDR
jgi:hypothetical protein